MCLEKKMPTHKNVLTIHEFENFKQSLLTHIGELIVREMSPKDSDRASKEAPLNKLWNEEEKAKLEEANCAMSLILSFAWQNPVFN